MSNNVYQMVTDRIIAQMEQGIIPWQQPWTGGANVAISHTTGRAYSFLNQLLLGLESGEYITFKQCEAEGGKIKKGEKSRFVVFWTWLPKKGVEKAKPGEDINLSDYIPYLRYYHVFNINQCEGIEPRFLKEDKSVVIDPIADAEKVVDGYFSRETCKLKVCNSAEAYYRPSTDEVVVPQLSQYKEAEQYYSTLFHEMTHSTGHKSRLDRFTDARAAAFGSDEYSREELVAEMGSAFILGRLGIDSNKAFKNSVGYLQNWLEHIKGDSKLIVTAAGKAEAAANYIFDGTKPNHKK